MSLKSDLKLLWLHGQLSRKAFQTLIITTFFFTQSNSDAKSHNVTKIPTTLTTCPLGWTSQLPSTNLQPLQKNAKNSLQSTATIWQKKLVQFTRSIAPQLLNVTISFTKTKRLRSLMRYEEKLYDNLIMHFTSVSLKFNLNCDKEYYLPLIGTINNVGQLFCYLMTGFLSDRYGRKFVLIMGTLGSGVFGILRMFSFSYAQFAIFEFLDSFFGAATYSTAFIIGLELVTPKHRTVFGTLLNCFYALGEIYLGVIAMWFRNYKTILLIAYVPAFLTISYICILPQSQFILSFVSTNLINQFS